MKKRALVVLAVLILFLAFLPGVARTSADTGSVWAAADTGFRPDRDGFAFANFGDPLSVAGLDLGRMTGAGFHDEIFSHTGHCFGMAMVSVQRYLEGDGSIGLAAADVMPEIDRIQTEQSFYYIADYFRPPFGEKTYDCSAEYARVHACLAAGRPAVIGVYPSAGGYPGHAVVAYRIETEGEKSYIYVYDPNFPATARDYEAEPLVAVFDRADGTFRYDNGQTFDELQLDEVDGTGIALGKTLSAGFVGVPCMAIALLIWRPRFRRHP